MIFRNPIVPVLLENREFTDIHSHTKLTDGSASVAAMCRAAKKNGLKFFVVSEHVRLDLEYDYSDFIIQADKECSKDFTVIPGSEAKVLDGTGQLDMNPETAALSRFKIASFHSRPVLRENFLAAMESMLAGSRADVWGHPFALDVKFTESEWQKLCLLAKQNNVVIEISNRYPMPEWAFTIVQETGCPFLYGSDAHEPADIRKAGGKPVFRSGDPSPYPPSL